MLCSRDALTPAPTPFVWRPAPAVAAAGKQVCCPLTKLCVLVGAACTPPLPAFMQARPSAALPAPASAAPAAAMPLSVCNATEYCCPDAKHCLTPTATSCAAGPEGEAAAECAAGQVCCPLTKICVKPGAACQSPCAAKEYCCPDARKCLTPTNPGTFCSAAKDCKKNELCCPLTNLCVSAGASCVPAFFE